MPLYYSFTHSLTHSPMRGKGKKALSPSQFRRWSPCANKLTRGFFLLALLVLLAAVVFVVVAVVVAVVAVAVVVEAGASGFISLTLGAAIAEAALAAAALPGQSASALAGASILPGFHRAREWGRGAKRSCLFADGAGLAELDGGQRRMALESSSFLFKTSSSESFVLTKACARMRCFFLFFSFLFFLFCFVSFLFVPFSLASSFHGSW